MTDEPDCLPPLVMFSEYGGVWASYLGAIYDYFKRDFVDSKPVFQGRRFSLKRHPLTHAEPPGYFGELRDWVRPQSPDRIADDSTLDRTPRVARDQWARAAGDC